MSLHREHSLARTKIHDTILHPMNTIIYARSSLDCALSAEDQAASLPRDSKVGRSATRRMAGLVGFRVGIAQS